MRNPTRRASLAVLVLGGLVLLPALHTEHHHHGDPSPHEDCLACVAAGTPALFPAAAPEPGDPPHEWSPATLSTERAPARAPHRTPPGRGPPALS